jgi:hypothetical protein
VSLTPTSAPSGPSSPAPPAATTTAAAATTIPAAAAKRPAMEAPADRTARMVRPR